MNYCILYALSWKDCHIICQPPWLTAFPLGRWAIYKSLGNLQIGQLCPSAVNEPLIQLLNKMQPPQIDDDWWEKLRFKFEMAAAREKCKYVWRCLEGHLCMHLNANHGLPWEPEGVHDTSWYMIFQSCSMSVNHITLEDFPSVISQNYTFSFTFLCRRKSQSTKWWHNERVTYSMGNRFRRDSLNLHLVSLDHAQIL